MKPTPNAVPSTLPQGAPPVRHYLQFADFTDPRGLTGLAAAQAAAEGVLGHERTIERLARSALGAAIVREATTAPHWRELFVAVEVGGVVVEGYIDLLVRLPGRGLVVVDYKTDQLHGATERATRLQRYGVQLATYGVALERLLGEPVAGGVLVMCRPDQVADEVAIEGWAELSARLRRGLLGP